MKNLSSRKPGKAAEPAALPQFMVGSAVRRASIFRNGSNQAVRLPQDLRFADNVREVRIRRLAHGLLISPVRPDWASFFALTVDVPDDFLSDRDDQPPQVRNPL
ncbi:MAG: type II toxin-antitoxin system VapB family antitoxin [Gammaproteobacteria bacterium]